LPPLARGTSRQRTTEILVIDQAKYAQLHIGAMVNKCIMICSRTCIL